MSDSEKPVELVFYDELYTTLLSDTAILCGVKPSSTKHDQQTVLTRSASEGMAFYTKTLPSLGKALDKALAKGVPMVCPPSFAVNRRSNCPIFMGSYFAQILDADGNVAETACSSVERARQVEAVRAVRQVCYLTYKLELPYSKECIDAFLDNFQSVDQSLPCLGDEVLLSSQTALALRSARMLLWYVLKDVNLKDIVPGHGPGSVATGELGRAKMKFARFYAELEEEYPYTEYFFFNYTHLCDDLESLEALVDCERKCSKVCLVPKDSRGPRTISMEPLELQWIQQGQRRVLVNHIEHHALTRGFVNFTNQEVNRRLALASSLEDPEDEQSSLVTLDMKDASDRVSDWLVDRIFPTHVLKALRAARSEYTTLPSGTSFKLRKFAPMGSSVCFPVEALTFWALAVGTLRHVRRWRDTSCLPPVYVYGDDIVARKDHYDLFRPVFEELHLRFNEDKCCTSRFFRESCGCDALNGLDVTPVKMKTPWATKSSPKQQLSYQSYVNSLGDRHLQSTRNLLLSRLEAKTGPLPRVSNTSTLLGGVKEPDWDVQQLLAYTRSHFRTRYNRGLQRDEFRYRVVIPQTHVCGEPDWSEILRLVPHYTEKEVGEAEQRLEPCCYTLPHRVMWGWRWAPLDAMLGQL